jgi:hypothetical protein
VIETCRKIVTSLSLPNLEFRVGDIAAFLPQDPVDLMISLHACDTATDDAIGQAIQWNCTAILAVPCCQHELNDQIADSALVPISTYGITKDRFAAIATDTMRASLLTACGYQTQVMEFIDIEHTPKNLLIRATRRMSGSNGETSATSKTVTRKALVDVQHLRAQLDVGPLTLERRLIEAGVLAASERSQSLENNAGKHAQDKDAAF